MMLNIFTVLGVLFSLFLSDNLPEGTVQGKVFDKDTGERLPGVYVLYGNNKGTVTEADGTYLIRTRAGRLRLSFQYLGYETVEKDITLIEDDTLELDISMSTRLREIDQVVVSAGRTEQRIAELSVSMNIITTSFLSSNHITDPQEIINKTAGIEVLDGQASVRGGSGFSYGAGSRVLALIDGLPVVSADAGNIKWQYLPLENISRIEIIKGASSVLYGSSALNGIINFRTADASNIPVTQFFTEAGIYGNPKNKNWKWSETPRFFSNTSFSHLRKEGRTDLGISGNITTDDGYRRLNGETLGRLGLKIKHFSDKTEGLNYGMNVFSGYNIKKDFVLWEDAEYGALRQSEATAREFNGSFLALDPFISFKKTEKYSHDLKMRLQSTTSRLPDDSTKDSDAYSWYSEYQIWKRVNEYIDITGGLSGNFSSVISNFFDDHRAVNIAGFAQLEARPLTALRAVAGLRLESNTMDGIHDGLQPVFRAGLNWQAGKLTFLRASFGQGYRFPSMAERYAATTIGSIMIIANPSIIPESGWNAELGIKQGLSFGRLSGQADLSAFYMRASDMIEYTFGFYSEGLGFKALNREESRIYGTEAEILLKNICGKTETTFAGVYTFIYPVEVNPLTMENTSIYLKYRRKHSLKVNIDAVREKLNAGLGFYWKSKILNIDDVFLTTPILPGFYEYWKTHNTGYFLMDFSLGYSISAKLKLSLAVKNLTNTEYMGRPGDIQAQRNYTLRLSGKL
ncbi:MAG: TonB-dependent receptor [Bacteroidetes bacterium]|nr:TonB-dependent receptor [Bacteroidota bacterium]